MSCQGKLKTSEAKVQELNKASEANLAAAAAKASAESAAKTTDEPRCFLKAVLEKPCFLNAMLPENFGLFTLFSCLFVVLVLF